MAGQTFTTYINAKRTGSVDAEFAAIEQRAKQSLSGIQQKAEQASRAMAGLTGGRGAAGLSNMRPIPPAVGASIEQTRQRADKLAASQARLARENSRLVQSLRTTGQTLQVVQGPLGPIAGRVNAAADAMSRMTGVSLGLAGAGAALFAYARAANTFVEVRSKLMPLFDSQEQVNGALDKVAGIAQRARTGLEPVVDLYAKLKLSADQYGISQERALRITELASKAATLSGGSSQSREAGLYQFAQGFGSGTLAGDELKSVKENTLGLARALSTGLSKLPEFAGIDVSVGKLKDLGAQGKLTADVIARAMEASAGQIEADFSKLPPTLGTAFTGLTNSATLFVGKFEQATGIVGTLASGVTLLGNNLGVIVSLLAGVAAGWAAVTASQRSGGALQGVRDQINSLRAQQQAAQSALATATRQKNMVGLTTIALRNQEQAHNANIVALEKQLAVQRTQRQELAFQARVNPAGPARRMLGGLDASIVQNVRALADETEKLSTTQVRAAENGRRLEGTTRALGEAKRGAAKASSLMKMGAVGLLNAINPLGIAVGLATAAFLAWATSKSAAEKAAGKLEDAQRTLQNVIDVTTGKVIQQNEALLANARLQGQEAAAAGKRSYNDTRQQIAGLGRRFEARTTVTQGGAFTSTPRLSATQMQAQSLLKTYGAGGTKTGSLIAALGALAKADPSLKGLADQVTRLGSQAVETAQGVAQTEAQLNLLAGRNDAETRRRAAGDFSGGRAIGETAGAGRNLEAEAEAMRKQLRDKRFAATTNRDERLAALEERRSKMGADEYVRERAQILASYDAEIAQIGAAEGRAAARAEREKEKREREHARELARIEAENQARERRTEKRSDILGQWSDEPKMVVKAADQIDDLRRLVGETMNGLTEITEKNPLGQGIYTAEMAAADADRIREGLLRPFDDLMEAQDRQRTLQELTLGGYDLEAEALSRIYDLHDQVGKVSVDQYQAILSNLEAEERINDALEQRDRLLAPLRESVGALRGDIVTAIEDLMGGGNPLKGAKNIIKGLMSQFNKASAVQLAEKITGGLDARVRDLMRGSVNVDTKIADYIEALNRQGGATDGLASSLNAAANAAQNAAGALNAIAGSPGVIAAPGAAGALGAGGSSIMGYAASALYGMAGANLPSSFYKSGVQVGGGKGDDIIYKALGGLGVITDNLRSQARQNEYYSKGLSPTRNSNHVNSTEAWDVRLPTGMSFRSATDAIRKTAAQMGVALIEAIDETKAGGTGRHGHYTFGRGPGSYAGAGGMSPAMSADVGGMIGGMPGSIAVEAIKSVASVAESLSSGPMSTTGEPITVTGTRRAQDPEAPKNAREHYNMIGEALGTKLDSILGTNFLGGIGKQLGNVMQGAQTGAMASGFAKMLGLKQSNTGAMIGGAVGSLAGLIPGVGPLIAPIASAIGGLIGGTIGGMFKKTKKASATITSVDGQISVGEATGNSGKREAASSAMAGSVGDSLQRIADMLGASIGSFAVSIGVRKDKFRVDTTGQGRTKNVKSFESEEEAIRYALMDAIKDGAIMGLSVASQTILKKATDLERALNKVQIIESIPKRLMALKDPVRFAIMELNREFAQMIAYLKEGGATAGQFAEAQELYDLERARAMEAAAKQVSSAIQDYIDEMLGGSSSPLNKRTVYENAKGVLDPLAADVAAGKAVDTDALLKAVQNFQEASKELNGSSQSFFADFDYLLGLLNTAKANVEGSVPGTGTGAPLPASPFSDAAIQALINGSTGTTQAINNQTNVLGGLLGSIINSLGGNYTAPSTAIQQLPTQPAPTPVYGGTGGGQTYNNGGISPNLVNHV